MARQKKCAEQQTWKDTLLIRLKISAKWSFVIILCLAIAILHDLLWFSSYNILLQEQSGQQTLLDFLIKNIILLLVSSYIVPGCASLSIIAVYAILLSWLALAQNLPNIDSAGDMTKIWVEHGKCALNLFQKFFIFKLVMKLKGTLHM